MFGSMTNMVDKPKLFSARPRVTDGVGLIIGVGFSLGGGFNG